MSARPRRADPGEMCRHGAAPMSELASESSTQRLREAPTERSEAAPMSGLASESSTQRLREAPTERSEGER
jgi:hypothetical protein